MPKRFRRCGILTGPRLREEMLCQGKMRRADCSYASSTFDRLGPNRCFIFARTLAFISLLPASRGDVFGIDSAFAPLYLIGLGFLVVRIVGYSQLARWLYKSDPEVEELSLPADLTHNDRAADIL